MKRRSKPQTITYTQPSIFASEGFAGFPATLFLIEVEPGRYAANNATLPDLTQIDGLACFKSCEDACIYMSLSENRGIVGVTKEVTFSEARYIAKEKEQLNCLLLFANGFIIDYHFTE